MDAYVGLININLAAVPLGFGAITSALVAFIKKMKLKKFIRNAEENPKGGKLSKMLMKKLVKMKLKNKILFYN